MSKPRIVREDCGDARDLNERHDGPAYLALPWPEACPYTPEAVMAACERAGDVPLSVPMRNTFHDWVIVVGFLHWRNLTPEFMGEPKRCEHGVAWSLSDSGGGGVFMQCSSCGAILSDRRKGERRARIRRPLCIDAWGRRQSLHDRRTGKDRRRPHV